MSEYVLYVLLSIIAICLVIIVYFFSKMRKIDESDITFVEQQQKTSEQVKNSTPKHCDCMIPSDVVFDNKNLPVRTTRSRKRKVNYGKDFNAYLVKGGTLYHKKSCKKLNGKKITTKHIYECIADKNKRACPICNPRAEIHDWYKAKFPDSIYVKSYSQDTKTEQLNMFDIDMPENKTDE